MAPPSTYIPRKKLPALEGTVALSRPPSAAAPPVCPHNTLPLFDLSNVKATLLTSKAPTVNSSWLPPHLAETVASWARPIEALTLPDASEDQLKLRNEQLEAEATALGAEVGEITSQEKVWQEHEVDVLTKKMLPRMFASASSPKQKKEETQGTESGEAAGVSSSPAADTLAAAAAAAVPSWPVKHSLERGFVRFWTTEQRKLTELDHMLSASGLPTSHDKAVAEARRKGLEPPPPPTPEGPFRDELMVAVFNAVNQLKPLVGAAQADNSAKAKSKKVKAGGGVSFLWEAIYPQQPNGLPCFNPDGVYCVKLWCAGAWRSVQVDDSLPLNSKGECVLPGTEHEPAELWPLILSKALYKVVEASSMGKRSEDVFSLRWQAHGKHGDNASALASGGVFGFLVHALTAWQVDAPKTLSTLAAANPTSLMPQNKAHQATPLEPLSPASPQPFGSRNEPASPAGNTMSGDMQRLSAEPLSPASQSSSQWGAANAAAAAQNPQATMTAAEASRALVRHLVNDGVPCAPLEQFKYDEVYRATVSAALGKDPFLVNTSTSKWPKPPEKRRKHNGKKKNGGELATTIARAGKVREQRVAEIKQKLFDPAKRTRVFALCATEAPPPPPPSRRKSGSLRGAVRRLSSFGLTPPTTSRATTPQSPATPTAVTGGGEVQTNKAEAPGAGVQQVNQTSTNEVTNNLPSGDGALALAGAGFFGDSECLEEESSTATGTVDATSHTGSFDICDAFGNLLNPGSSEDEDSHDEEGSGGEEEPNGQGGAAELLSPGMSSMMPQPNSTPINAGAVLSPLTGSSMARKASSTSALLATQDNLSRQNSEMAPLYPGTRILSHVILAVGLRASALPLAVSDAKDLGHECGGDGCSKVSDRRLGWLRSESASTIQHFKHAQQEASGQVVPAKGGSSSADGAESVSSSATQQFDSEPPEPKLLVLWRDPQPLSSNGGASGEEDQDEDGMPHFSPEHPATAKGNLRWITPSNFITAMGGPTQVSLVTLFTRNAMIPQPPPPAHNNASLANTTSHQDSTSSSLLTLRSHWTADGGPGPSKAPTLLRIITRSEEELDNIAAAAAAAAADDNGSLNGSLESQSVGGNIVEDLAFTDDDPSARMIRLLISVESDPLAPRDLDATASADGGDGGGGAKRFFTQESNSSEEPAGVVKASGGVLVKPVPFIAPDPTDFDEDDDEDDEDGQEEEGMLLGGEESQNGGAMMPSGWNRTVAWVNEWRRPPLPLTPSLLRHDSTRSHETGSCSGSGNKPQTMTEFNKWRPPSGAYRHAVNGMPDGTVSVVVTPSPVYLASGGSQGREQDADNGRKGVLTVKGAPALPFHFSTTEVLLPAVPRAKRTDSRPGTDAKAFSRDYFLQVHLDLPTGGLVHFACSERLVLGSAAEVWGAGLAPKAKPTKQQAVAVGEAASAADENAVEPEERSEARETNEVDDEATVDDGESSLASSNTGAGAGDANEAAKSEKRRGKLSWKHSRHAEGSYPALPATVAPSMQSSRDRRGRGNYDLNHESWAILFRYTVKVQAEASSKRPGGGAMRRRPSMTQLEGVSSGGEGSSEQPQATASSSTLIDDVMAVSSEVGCRFKLHLSDPSVARYVRLVTIAPNPADGRPYATSHPLLETKPLRWRPNLPAGAHVVLAVLEKPPHVAVDPGTWSLVMLADGPVSALQNLEASETDSEAREAKNNATLALAKFERLHCTSKLLLKNEGGEDGGGGATGDAVALATNSGGGGGKNRRGSDIRERHVWRVPHGPMARAHRWGGVYQPNNELKLFDDVLTSGSSSSCKVSLRVEVFPQTKSSTVSYSLRLRVYQKLSTSKNSQSQAQAQAKGHNDGVKIPPLQAKAGYELVEERRGNEHVQVELVTLTSGLLLELTLDERRMDVPSVLRSKTPYFATVQDQLSAHAKAGQGTIEPQATLGLPHDGDEQGSGDSSSPATTWGSPEWRLIALPSSSSALALTPDPTTFEWVSKVHGKWADLRASSHHANDGHQKILEPAWLKANDSLLEDRTALDTAARKRYKQYQEGLKKGKRGVKKSSTMAAAAPHGSGQRGSAHQALVDSDPTLQRPRADSGVWFRGQTAADLLPVLPPSVVVDRILEGAENSAMFAEDDAHTGRVLAEQLLAGAALVEEQRVEMGYMQANTARIATEWAFKREKYRSAAVARVEAMNTLQEVGGLAVALPEGEKGTALGVLGGSGDSVGGASGKGQGKKGKK